MPDRLIRKLEHFVRLSADDRRAVERMAAGRLRMVDARQDIISEGEKPEVVNLILDGWACRYKLLEDGRRQIVAFFVPGDLCDINIFVLRKMDHSLGALTPVTLAEITRETLEETTLAHPRIMQALWWETLVAAAVQREWTVNIGQRDATERLAHLLCELFLRLRTVGLTDGEGCDFPVAQVTLAEATGLSNVHVSRTMTALRDAGLVSLRRRRLTIPDLNALMRVGLFNANYLHLDREGRHLDANR